RRAEPALQRMMLDERALYRVQLIAVGETFDRADALALGLDREHQAGPYRLVVEDHRARAADAVLAADMRPGQPAFVADDIDQRLSRLDTNGGIMTVDIELDFDLLGHRPPVRCAAPQLPECYMHFGASKAEGAATRAAAIVGKGGGRRRRTQTFAPCSNRIKLFEGRNAMSSSLSRRTLIKGAAGSAVLAGVGMPAIVRAQAD